LASIFTPSKHIEESIPYDFDMVDTLTPKLSLLIPTYNNALNLQDHFQRVLQLVSSDTEIIISDNASTDATRDTITRLTEGLPNCTIYYQHQNNGALFNFKFLIAKARGEFFCILPVGECYRVDQLRLMLDLMVERKLIGQVIPNIDVVLPDGKRVYTIVYQEDSCLDGKFAHSYGYALNNVIGLGLYGLFRTQIANKEDLFPAIRGGDVAFLRRVGTISHVAHISEVTYRYNARQYWNTFENDSDFFFGTIIPKSSRIKWIPGQHTLRLLISDLKWFNTTFNEELGVISVFIAQISYLFRNMVRRIVARILFTLTRGDLRIRSLTWSYFRLYGPPYVHSPQFPLFYQREILPSIGLQEKC
jgi:glycosyltransferase involved in cell wall biosynthesis